MSSALDRYLGAQLDGLRQRDLFRDPADAGERARTRERAAQRGLRFLDVTSNDYLGLAGLGVTDVSRETAGGAGASRLIYGTHAAHELLEAAVADWVGLPTSLLFASGFAANLGVLTALAGPESVVFSDELNHASIIDGCRLARAQVQVLPHRSLSALDTALARARGAAARWVVTESYFSMDGDAPDLAAIRALCDRHRAFLLVDEAHALGVFGPRGAGRCAEAGVTADALVGTMGKSIGLQGAFAAGSETLRAFLWNRARSFVFSTAPSPALCAWGLERIRAARAAEAARERLLLLCATFRAELEARGVPLLRDSFGPIVPILIGPSRRALEVAAALRADGVLAQAIRPPTVPEGLARLRVTLTANLRDQDVLDLAERLVLALGKV